MSQVPPTATANAAPAVMTRLHIVRTTAAALASQGIASLVGLPEPYWATITSLVVMQSTLTASWAVSSRRLLGTAIGATAGGVLATLFPSSTLAFAVALAATGAFCALTGLDRVSYRFTGITLAIVMLVARSRPAWLIAPGCCPSGYRRCPCRLFW